MRIAVAGPCYLPKLAHHLPKRSNLPNTYSFPYISDLVNEYLRQGHEVDLITSSEAVRELTVLGGDGLRVYIGRRRSSARHRAFDFFGLERHDIGQALRMSQPDVIHAHWLYEYAAASLGYQPDALVTAHDAPVSVLRHYHHPYWLFRELLGLRSLRHVINLTAVAPQLRNELVRLAPRASTISVVPNGIELTSGDHAVRKVRKASKPVFACIANGFDRRKNTAAVIKAFHSVVQKLPEAELRLYGAGHGGNEEAHVWSRKHGLDRNLSYKGLTSHEQIKADLKDTIDIIVHPSKWEACSLAILEARSYGIPVIGGAKSGGVPYTLDQGGAGMVIDRLHVSNLESAMLKLAQDQDAYKRISSRALAGLNPTFNLANVASTYLILLENIYRSRGVPRNASG